MFIKRYLLKTIGLLLMLCEAHLINGMEQSIPAKTNAPLDNDICLIDGRSLTCSVSDLSMRIKKCIELGTPIDGATFQGTFVFVPLLCATRYKDPALTEWLLARGASCSVSNTCYKSPIHALFGLSNNESKERLLQIMEYYQTRFPHTQEAIIMMQLAGTKPLIHAAKNNDERLARRCLEYGLDPNIQDECGKTALMSAVEYNAYNVINVLLEYGVDITKTDKDARTALDYAKRGFSASLKQTLATFPPFTNTKTPMHYQQATPEDEKTAQEIMTMNTEKLNNPPPSPSHLVPVIASKKPKNAKAKKPTKRRSYKEEDDEDEGHNQYTGSLPEATQETGFIRPDLIMLKRSRQRKKTY